MARNDLELYETHAASWWDPTSAAFRSLHAVKAHHLDRLREAWGEDLRGWRVVDLGCGGGLLGVPLREAGAEVIGVDRSRGSLRAAREEADRRGLDLGLAQGDLRRSPLRPACARAVLLSDVLEHVEDPGRAVAEAGRLLEPGGWLYANTLNRTWRARVLAVGLAEGVGLVPRGTHDPRLFVRPDELLDMGRAAGLEPVRVLGEGVRWGRTLRRWAVHLRPGRDTSVGYGVLFRRRA